MGPGGRHWMPACFCCDMIGILGGTFDPIHFGHLRPAYEAQLALGLETLYFVPANLPPHRAAPVASAQQRLLMVELALTQFTQFTLDGREVTRDGISYTVDTLQAYRKQYGDVPLVLLMGTDAFTGIETWHEWHRIPELTHIAVMQRPGWQQPALPGWIRGSIVEHADRLRQTPAGLVHFLPVKPQPYSATAIREALAKGESVEDMLPTPVLDYLITNRIYTK